MRRRPDWPERMAAVIERAMNQPFCWGTHDCVTFAADVVVAISDVDPLAGLRGRWHTERGAARILRGMGGLHAAWTGALGEPLSSPLMAGRGDVALVRQAVGERAVVAMAVVDAGFWCLPGPDGLVQGEDGIVAAWRI